MLSLFGFAREFFMMMFGLLYLPYLDFRPKFHVIRDRSSSHSVTESPYPSVLYLEGKNTYRLRTFLVMHVIHMTIFPLFVCSCKKLTYKDDVEFSLCGISFKL